jgi:hypothetical protein
MQYQIQRTRLTMQLRSRIVVMEQDHLESYHSRSLNYRLSGEAQQPQG